MSIAKHVSGCTSSLGRDLPGKGGLRSRQSTHQLPAADSPPNRAAERRDTGQQIKALSNSVRSELPYVCMFWNNAANYCSRQKPPVSPPQWQEGQIHHLTAPHGDVAARSQVEVPSLLRIFVIPDPRPVTKMSCKLNAHLGEDFSAALTASQLR